MLFVPEILQPLQLLTVIANETPRGCTDYSDLLMIHYLPCLVPLSRVYCFNTFNENFQVWLGKREGLNPRAVITDGYSFGYGGEGPSHLVEALLEALRQMYFPATWDCIGRHVCRKLKLPVEDYQDGYLLVIDFPPGARANILAFKLFLLSPEAGSHYTARFVNGEQSERFKREWKVIEGKYWKSTR